MFGFILKWFKKPETPEEKKKRKEREDREYARKSDLRVRINLWRMWLAYLDRTRREKLKKKLLEKAKKHLEKWLEVIQSLQNLYYQVALDFIDTLLKSKILRVKDSATKAKSDLVVERGRNCDMLKTKVTSSPFPEIKKRPRSWSNQPEPPLDKNSQEYKKEKAKLEKLREISQFAADNKLSLAEANPDLMETLAKKLGKCVCRRNPCLCGGEGGDDGTSNNVKQSIPKKQIRKDKENSTELQPS